MFWWWRDLGDRFYQCQFFPQLPAGIDFGIEGAICYVSDEIRSRLILGFLNSTVVSSLLAATSPTIDYGEGAIGRVPVHQGLFSSNIDHLVDEVR